MRWITHQAAALCLALQCHLPPAGIAAAVAGAVVPDVLDQKLAGLVPGRRLRQKVFNRIHRGTTHWFGWWLGLLLWLSWAPPHLALPPWMRPLALGLALGALSHVATDILTPRGVPLLPLTRRWKMAVPLCSTGSWQEYLFLAACLLLSVWLVRPGIFAFLHRI